MTYTRKRVSPFKIDVLKIDKKSGQRQDIAGSIVNTRATLHNSNERIRLYSGSHWRISWSAGQLYESGNNNKFINTTIYDWTNSAYIGTNGVCSGWYHLTRGRSVASALILNSDITSNSYIELGFYYDTYNGTHTGSWQNNAYNSVHNTNMAIVIMELPT